MQLLKVRPRALCREKLLLFLEIGRSPGGMVKMPRALTMEPFLKLCQDFQLFACKTTDPHQIHKAMRKFSLWSSFAKVAVLAPQGVLVMEPRRRLSAREMLRMSWFEAWVSPCRRAAIGLLVWFGSVPLTSGCPPLKRSLTLDQVGFNRFGVMLFLGPIKYSS